MFSMMFQVYDSDARQFMTRSELENIRVEKVMTENETTDKSIAISNILTRSML